MQHASGVKRPLWVDPAAADTQQQHMLPLKRRDRLAESPDRFAELNRVQQRGSDMQLAIEPAAAAAAPLPTSQQEQPLSPPLPLPQPQQHASSSQAFCLDFPNPAHMHSILRHAAATEGRPLLELWHDGQRVLLEHMVQQLAAAIHDVQAPCTDEAKPTAGVSFVVESESQQEGASGGQPPLPHLVFRPPGLLELHGNPQIMELLQCVQSEAS